MTQVIWVPYVAPGASAECLDDDDLATQITAVATVLRHSYGQQQELPEREIFLPSRMWAGFPLSLAIRGMVLAEKLSIDHDRPDLVPQDDLRYIIESAKELEEADEPQDDPPWMGDPDVHRSHRSNMILHELVDADLFPATPVRMPILWPQLVAKAEKGYRLRISGSDERLLNRRLRVLPPWLRWDAEAREVVPA